MGPYDSEKCRKCSYNDLGMCYNEHYCEEKDGKPKEERPPLGLMPKKLWDAQRMRDIYDAMERYSAAGKAVPLALVQELRSIEVKPLDETDFE